MKPEEEDEEVGGQDGGADKGEKGCGGRGVEESAVDTKGRRESLLFLPSAARRLSTLQLPLDGTASERLRLCCGATPICVIETRAEMVLSAGQIKDMSQETA